MRLTMKQSVVGIVCCILILFVIDLVRYHELLDFIYLLLMIATTIRIWCINHQKEE